MLATPNRKQIFRENAVQHHIYSREKDILPRFTRLPVPLFLWIFLGLLLTTGFVAWNAEIPTYASGPGIVLNKGSYVAPGSDEAVAICFFARAQATHLRVGLPVQVQFGSVGPGVSSSIAQVLPGVISPAAAGHYFGTASPVMEPAVAALVRLGPGVPASVYAGSRVSAQVQTGTERIISFLPLIGNLIGG